MNYSCNIDGIRVKLWLEDYKVMMENNMKICLIHGSPIIKSLSEEYGNQMIFKFCRENICSFENIYDFKLSNLNISICDGCNECKISNVCKHNDSFREIYESMILSDILVITTPMYWWGISSHLKIFLDRLHSIDVKNFISKRRKLILILTYEDPDPNPGIKIIEETFNIISEYLNFDFEYFYELCNID